MKTTDIRKIFLNYFKKNEHEIVQSSPLIPHNDPSLMFTSAGMVQFKNFFTGIETPKYNKASTAQKCVRAGGKHNDLENVGYTARHHTFFEMLGNFSFGDYFKEKAIFYAWDLLVNEIKLPKERLYFTVYHTDDEAFELWKKLGVDPSRIIRIATSDNFWSMGDTGPCGPCSEIFYDHGESLEGGLPGTPTEGGDRFVEIWNLVFMQFEQHKDGSQTTLPNPSIDTGMGLERFAAVLQNVHDNYDTDLFKNLINDTQELIGTKITSDNKSSFKVIADHLRSTSFLIADGVMPSNEGRGYVLRRIIRRAMRHANFLGHAKEPLLTKLVSSLIREMGTAYPELARGNELITETLKLEESKFLETLDRGLKLLNQETHNLKASDPLPGEVAFKLYDTYGFPLDLTCDIMRKEQREVDTARFDQEMEKQKQLARASWQGSGEQATENLWFDLHDKLGTTEFLGYTLTESQAKILAIINKGQETHALNEIGAEFQFITNQTPFYGESGGQAGDVGLALNDQAEIEIIGTKKQLNKLIVHQAILKSGIISIGDEIKLAVNTERRDNLRKNHSATHVLHAALRKILGNHVTQKGSLVAEDRLRFDFSHHKSISKQELEQIEFKVNQIILNNSLVNTQVMNTEEAVQKGAMALFGEKYDDQVRVVSMGSDHENDHYSTELCGGTHVHSTGEIGLFKITSESSIASGIRRIEAVTGINALQFVQHQSKLLEQTSNNLKVPTDQITSKINSLQDEIKIQQKQIISLQKEVLTFLSQATKQVGSYKILAAIVDKFDAKELRKWAEQIEATPIDLSIVINTADEKMSILVSTAHSSLNAKNIAEELIKEFGGSGCGGDVKLAQGGFSKTNKINELDKLLEKILNRIAT
ncbi:alanine--tRNA ligase [Rickettsiales endosymbiont of Stachyamoeba lipophora]|uniref:alanine--tRNA ligase n=1 Tax=Rickettsiales endosymbiont of Stachyamoeba lipophora TaxID=2486578 RepID=UPI000F64E237|nr:alanine--tRNA ligase [Rickettsiales endosymbiont of Stachyamoeba lipophora]AZL15221.1 alanine--tRNA ligase [Rickettsiales endosymbiont of Stachyamoeba lipophora]